MDKKMQKELKKSLRSAKRDVLKMYLKRYFGEIIWLPKAWRRAIVMTYNAYFPNFGVEYEFEYRGNPLKKCRVRVRERHDKD